MCIHGFLYSHSQTLTWHLYTNVKEILKFMYLKLPLFFPRFPLSTTEPILGLNMFTELSSVSPFSLIQPSLDILHLQDTPRTQPYSSITTIWINPPLFLCGMLYDHPADSCCPLCSYVVYLPCRKHALKVKITCCFPDQDSPMNLIKTGML